MNIMQWYIIQCTLMAELAFLSILNLQRTSSEVLNVLGQLIKMLQTGRSSLLIPRKKTIDELLSSRNMVDIRPQCIWVQICHDNVIFIWWWTLLNIVDCIPFIFWQKSLTPPLPGDLAVSFYIQAHKLVLAVYHLSNAAGTMKFESVQAECAVPWLSPVLVCFTTALHLAHQLRDKVCIERLHYYSNILKLCDISL